MQNTPETIYMIAGRAKGRATAYEVLPTMGFFTRPFGAQRKLTTLRRSVIGKALELRVTRIERGSPSDHG